MTGFSDAELRGKHPCIDIPGYAQSLDVLAHHLRQEVSIRDQPSLQAPLFQSSEYVEIFWRHRQLRDECPMLHDGELMNAIRPVPTVGCTTAT